MDALSRRHPLLPATASPWWVVVAMLLYCAGVAVWIFSPAFPMHLLRRLQADTDGWIAATLVLTLVIGIGQLALVFGPGRQRPRDVGWRASALTAAVLATLAAWLAMNASTLIASLATGAPLQWNAGWAKGGLLPGALIAQLAGTALMEETVFRGWLWPQIALRLSRRLSAWGAWIGALLASQGLFALLHIPVRVAGGASTGEVATMVLGLFAIGIVFALLYAATRNLVFVVGLHALGNAPTLMFEPQGPAPTLVMLGVAVAIAAAWAWRRRRVPRRASVLAPLVSRA